MDSPRSFCLGSCSRNVSSYQYVVHAITARCIVVRPGRMTGLILVVSTFQCAWCEQLGCHYSMARFSSGHESMCWPDLFLIVNTRERFSPCGRTACRNCYIAQYSPMFLRWFAHGAAPYLPLPLPFFPHPFRKSHGYHRFVSQIAAR